MNAKTLFAKTLIAATVACGAGIALADDVTIVKDEFVPTLSRAEVQAQTARARADGTGFTGGEAGTFPMAQPQSQKTRDAVRNEAIQARRAMQAMPDRNSDPRA